MLNIEVHEYRVCVHIWRLTLWSQSPSKARSVPDYRPSMLFVRVLCSVDKALLLSKFSHRVQKFCEALRHCVSHLLIVRVDDIFKCRQAASHWYSGGLADQEEGMTLSLPSKLNSRPVRWLCTVLHQSVTSQWSVCAVRHPSTCFVLSCYWLGPPVDCGSVTVELSFRGPIDGSVVHWWNGSLQEGTKCSENIPSKCHYVCHKSHIDFPGTEPMLPGDEEAQLPPNVRPRHTKIKKGNISAIVMKREVIHSRVAVDPSSLGCDTASLWRWRHYDSFETSVNTRPRTRRHVPEDFSVYDIW